MARGTDDLAKPRWGRAALCALRTIASVAVARHDGSLPSHHAPITSAMAMNECMPVIRISNRSACYAFGTGTAEELARDLNIDPASLRYRCAGINHGVLRTRTGRKRAAGRTLCRLYPVVAGGL